MGKKIIYILLTTLLILGNAHAQVADTTYTGTFSRDVDKGNGTGSLGFGSSPLAYQKLDSTFAKRSSEIEIWAEPSQFGNTIGAWKRNLKVEFPDTSTGWVYVFNALSGNIVKQRFIGVAYLDTLTKEYTLLPQTPIAHTDILLGENVIVYEGVYNGVDLRYEAVTYKDEVKEELVVSQERRSLLNSPYPNDRTMIVLVTELESGAIITNGRDGSDPFTVTMQEDSLDYKFVKNDYLIQMPTKYAYLESDKGKLDYPKKRMKTYTKKIGGKNYMLSGIPFNLVTDTTNYKGNLIFDPSLSPIATGTKSRPHYIDTGGETWRQIRDATDATDATDLFAVGFNITTTLFHNRGFVTWDISSYNPASHSLTGGQMEGTFTGGAFAGSDTWRMVQVDSFAGFDTADYNDFDGWTSGAAHTPTFYSDDVINIAQSVLFSFELNATAITSIEATGGTGYWVAGGLSTGDISYAANPNTEAYGHSAVPVLILDYVDPDPSNGTLTVGVATGDTSSIAVTMAWDTTLNSSTEGVDSSRAFIAGDMSIWMSNSIATADTNITTHDTLTYGNAYSFQVISWFHTGAGDTTISAPLSITTLAPEFIGSFVITDSTIPATLVSEWDTALHGGEIDSLTIKNSGVLYDKVGAVTTSTIDTLTGLTEYILKAYMFYDGANNGGIEVDSSNADTATTIASSASINTPTILSKDFKQFFLNTDTVLNSNAPFDSFAVYLSDSTRISNFFPFGGGASITIGTLDSLPDSTSHVMFVGGINADTIRTVSANVTASTNKAIRYTSLTELNYYQGIATFDTPTGTLDSTAVVDKTDSLSTFPNNSTLTTLEIDTVIFALDSTIYGTIVIGYDESDSVASKPTRTYYSDTLSVRTRSAFAVGSFVLTVIDSSDILAVWDSTTIFIDSTWISLSDGTDYTEHQFNAYTDTTDTLTSNTQYFFMAEGTNPTTGTIYTSNLDTAWTLIGVTNMSVISKGWAPKEILFRITGGQPTDTITVYDSTASKFIKGLSTAGDTLSTSIKSVIANWDSLVYNKVDTSSTHTFGIFLFNDNGDSLEVTGGHSATSTSRIDSIYSDFNDEVSLIIYLADTSNVKIDYTLKNRGVASDTITTNSTNTLDTISVAGLQSNAPHFFEVSRTDSNGVTQLYREDDSLFTMKVATDSLSFGYTTMTGDSLADLEQMNLHILKFTASANILTTDTLLVYGTWWDESDSTATTAIDTIIGDGDTIALSTLYYFKIDSINANRVVAIETLTFEAIIKLTIWTDGYSVEPPTLQLISDTQRVFTLEEGNNTSGTFYALRDSNRVANGSTNVWIGQQGFQLYPRILSIAEMVDDTIGSLSSTENRKWQTVTMPGLIKPDSTAVGTIIIIR